MHKQRHCLWEGRQNKGKEDKKVETKKEEAGIKTRRELQTFPGGTCFLTHLTHSPSFPLQHLRSLVPTENWFWECFSWPCESCQISFEHVNLCRNCTLLATATMLITPSQKAVEKMCWDQHKTRPAQYLLCMSTIIFSCIEHTAVSEAVYFSIALLESQQNTVSWMWGSITLS